MSILCGDSDNILLCYVIEIGVVKCWFLWIWMFVQIYFVNILFIIFVVGVMWFGFLFFIEIVINIGYLCYLFIDDMMEVFVINGEILEFVQQVIVEYKSKVLVGVLEFKVQKVNSFRDVDVEVLLYKVYKDVVDILIFIQVIIY